MSYMNFSTLGQQALKIKKPTLLMNWFTCFIVGLMLFSATTSLGQSNPTPFSLAGGSFSLTSVAAGSTYPSNVQGWTTGTNNITSLPTAAPGADQALVAAGGAGVSGLSNLTTNGFNFLSTSSSPNQQVGEIVVALNATGRASLLVSWLAADNIATATRVMSMAMQYRLGTSGAFTNVGSTTYTTSGTSQLASQTFTNVALPGACDNQPVVQVRWVYWEVSGAGGRDAIRLDEISVSSSSGAATFNSIADGNWNVAGTWDAGVPTAGATVNITHNVLINSGVSNTGIINVNAGGQLRSSVAPSLTGAGTVNINGTGILGIETGGWPGNTNTFVYASTGTLRFNSNANPYDVNSGDTWWSGTNGPQNVNVAGPGTIRMNVARTVGGLFQTSSGVSMNLVSLTLNGTNQINTGGFFSNAPLYGSSSLLKYNYSGTYNRASEWLTGGGTVGVTAGYPNDVTVGSTTTLDAPNTGGSFAGNLQLNRDLTIDAGGSLYMDFGGPNKSCSLTVGRNATINGNLSLGNAVNGDMVVRGNWTMGAGTFSPNSRQVRFEGAAAQTITGATGFAYLKVNNGAANGVTLTGGASSLTIANEIDLTAGKITMGANSITMASGASFINASANSFLITSGVGVLTRNATTGTKSYPVGNTASSYTPLSIVHSGAANDISVNVSNSITNPVTDATRIVSLQWAVTASGAGSTGDITFNWNVANQAGSYNATGTGELGNYTTGPNYAITAIGALSGQSKSVSGVSLSAGSNLLVLGNTGAVYTAPPANDNCAAAATVLTDGTVVNGTFVASTVTPGNSFAYGTGKRDVWYTFTPTTTGNHTITITYPVSAPVTDIDFDVFTTSCPTTGTAPVQAHATHSTTETFTGSFNSGTVYYIRAIEWTANIATTFTITVQGPLPACATPTVPAVAPTYSGQTPTSTNGSFGQASPEPTGGYLVVQSTSATLSSNPVDGTPYITGNALGGGVVAANVTATNAPSYSFSSNGTLTSNTQYYYFVIPYNYQVGVCNYAYGNAATVSSSTFTCPGTVALPTTGTITSTTAQINWTSPGGAGPLTYDLEWRTSPSGSFTVINNVTSPYTLTGLTPGVAYDVQVRANNPCNGAYSAILTFNAGQIDAPTTLAADNITSSSFDAHWTQVPEATNYHLDVSTSATFGTSNPPVNQGFESVTFPPTGWTATGWTRSTTAGDINSGVAAAIAGSNNGSLTTSVVANPLSLSFFLGRSTNVNAKTLNIEVSTTSQVAGFATVATYDHSNVPSGSYNQYTVDLSAFNGSSTVYIRFTKVSATTSPWRLDDVVINSGIPSYVTGYSNLLVPGGATTTQSVNTNLAPNTTYYYRVRSSNATSTSVNSTPVISVTTCIATPTITPGGPTTFCQGGSVLLSSSAASGNQWNLDGTPIPTGGTNPTYLATVAGNYTVTVTGTCNPTSAITTVTVKPNPTMDDPANDEVCNGAPTAAVTFTGAPGGLTYNWTNDNTSIGLAAAGSGPIASFNGINNGTTPVVATITVTPTFDGCPGTPQSFTITVNPTPTVNDPADQVVCAGDPVTVNFTGSVGGATYTWTNDNVAIGLGAGPTAGNISFTSTNAGNTPISATVTVSPSANGCAGPSQTFTITINPTPTVDDPADQVVCAGDLVTVNFTGSVGGATYTWSNDNVAIGLGAGPTAGNISFTATNAGSTPLVATITVTPSANGCPGAPQTFTITVNPNANAGSVSGISPVCVNASAQYNVTGNNASGTWSSTNPSVATVSPTGLVTGIAGGTADIRYTITSGCNVPVFSFQTVAVIGTLATPGPLTGFKNVCPYVGNNTQLTYSVPAVPGATYAWVLPPFTTLISQTNNSIVITIQNGFIASANKQIRVTAQSPCGNSPQAVFFLLTQLPTTPQPIVPSSTNLCPVIGTATPISYTIPKVLAASSYIWTVTPSANITVTHPEPLPENDTVINITYNVGFNTANTVITVKASNDCGTSTARSYTVVKNNPTIPGLISGPNNACAYMLPNGAFANYSIGAVAGATNYTWGLPAGATAITGLGTNAVSFKYPANFTSGSISVTYTNGCGTSPVRTLSIGKQNAATPGVIDVIPPPTCIEGRVYSYTVNQPANATSVQWTYPAAATYISGQGTNSLTLSYPATAVNGNITAQGINNCSQSALRTLIVKLAACPPPEDPRPAFSKGGSVAAEGMSVNVFPNPTVSDFKMQVITAGKEVVNVRVLDLQGRAIRTLIVMPYETVSIGNELKAGTYMLEVRQGKEVKTTRLIKF